MPRRPYGCRPDRDDSRDHRFKLSLWQRLMPESWLPKVVDLRDFCPAVMDQGELGSCTAHGVTAALRYNLINSGGRAADVPLSRLQLYYDSRVLEGTVGEDSGCEIRDVIKTVAQKGVGREDLWPYDVTRFREKPPASVYSAAAGFMAVDYQRVGTSSRELHTALYRGRPVVIGVTLHRSFESDQVAKDGVVPMPRFNESEVGGHCMLLVGYKPGYDVVLNSWGADWGAKGFCFLPEGFLDKYGSDFWVINTNN